MLAPVGVLHTSIVLITVFMPQASGPLKCFSQILMSSDPFWKEAVSKGVYWTLWSEAWKVLGKQRKITPSLAAFLLKSQCKASSVPGVVGVASDVTSNPWKSCLATVSCPEAACSCLWCSALMMEILPSCVLGALCVSRWVYVVCIDFSIKLVWSYQLRCQTHLLSQFEFIFTN